MRLKIKVTRSLFGNARENRTGDLAAVILLRLRLRIVQDDESYELRIFSRQVTAERNNFLTLFVTAMWSDLLSGTSFSGDRETGHSRSCRGAAIANHAAQRHSNLARSLRRNDLS